MPKLQFFLTDITYRTVDSKAVVHLYGRTPDGKQVCVHDGHFEPYFYILPKDDVDALEKELLALKVTDKRDEYRVVRVDHVRKNVNEHARDLLKVIVNQPSGVPLLKDAIRKHPLVRECYEYDIKFVRRYLIDRKLQPMTLIEATGEQRAEHSRVPVLNATSVVQASDETLVKPRTLAVDIETYNPMGKRIIPEQHPILMLALYGDDFRKVITWKHFPTKEKYIEFVPSEADLLERFKQLVEEYKPDILAGYYSDGFDLPYIIKRAAKYKLKLDLGLDHTEMKISGTSQTTVQLTGIVHVDIYKFIKKVLGRSMHTSTFSLDAVAGELLGEQKHDVDLDRLAPAWDEGSAKELDTFAKYNLQDTKLTYDLTHKVLPNIIEFVKIIGLPLWDINRMSFSQLVEWYIIKQATAFNEVTLNRPSYTQQTGRMMARFKGALVFEPTPGLYNDIVVFDYRSLYPSIMASHNISPGTLNCTDCPDAKEVPLEGEHYHFCMKKRGFLSTVIEDLITRRGRIKEMLKKNGKDPLLVGRSEALKVLANSFYGYLGFAPARWYCFECGQSVTAYARHYISTTIEQAQQEGFKVLYSDTDSVFLMLGDKKKEDATRLVERINRDLPKLMELEYENFYPRGIFVAVKASESGAKKKYALIDAKGNLKIRGFETVRRNTAFIARDTQKDVLQIILKEGDTAKATAHVKQVIADLKANKVPLEKVVIWTQLTRDPREYASVGPHVAAAQRLQARGTPVGAGDMIKYVVTKGKGKIRDRVKLEDEARQDEYDPDYYIDNQVIPAVERIFAVLGVKIEELTQQSSQSTLGGFG
jgi:DNA polymerase I